MIDKNDLFRQTMSSLDKSRYGTAGNGNIDKTGLFYHVVTKSFYGKAIFRRELADYRQILMRNLCEERGITIIFSVTMPNHTHEIFLAPDWSTLAEMMRILNLNVTKQIRMNNKEKFPKKVRILRRNPIYVVIRDIKTLFYEGKYLFDNPQYLKDEKKIVPYNGFWMFESGHFLSGYDQTIYKKLFDMDPDKIFALYTKYSKEEIRAYADRKFSNWTDEMNQRIFYI